MKTNIFLSTLVAVTFFSCNNKLQKTEVDFTDNPDSKEVLLIGTFHYNNPGADVAKTKSFDILNKNSQQELEKISATIKKYNPTKIFVEWPFDEQTELDSLYQLYLTNEYFTSNDLSNFYLKNEIFQLAFRVAKENNLKTVYGIDYTTSFPFEDVMNDIDKSNQSELRAEIEGGISKFTAEFDEKIDAGASLIELTYYLNTPEMRSFSNHFHNNLMLLAGESGDFSGASLTSEWFKRNLYMWSLIQKNTNESDEAIMVLVGSSHAAMFELFIDQNSDWEVKELQEIME